ncbi:Nucleosome assembly protein 1-like 4 [Echinococcus granulosus]|nr:Nucleosome assembly protein 1-like 4 [Echinococcus granulosus]
MDDPATTLIHMISQALSPTKQEDSNASKQVNSPKEVADRVDALKTLFKKRASIHSEYLKELYALEFKYARLYAPIYLQQRAIVTGKDVEEMEEDEPLANPKTLGDAELDVSLNCAPGLGIPGYWAKVLRAAPLMRNYLTEMDMEILQYLEGIRYSFSKKLSSPGFRLVFMFKQNPFFKDIVLMKQFSLKFIDQCEDLNEFGPTKVTSTKASQIDWTSSHEPTGDVAVPPKDSFFNLFRDLQPDALDTPEYVQMMEDYDICVYIRDRVLPYAVYWYTGEREASEPPNLTLPPLLSPTFYFQGGSQSEVGLPIYSHQPVSPSLSLQKTPNPLCCACICIVLVLVK